VTETFEPDWLALREEADHRARAPELLLPLRRWWTERGASAVLDLGSGTGSNLRYLAHELDRPQRWTLVDHDADLLARAAAPSDEISVRTVRGDLAEAGLAEAREAHLVSASALLDLVSEAWLQRLADVCAAASCAALFALTYDGGVDWDARDPADVLVYHAVNEHQRRDKGLGPALGPEGADAAETFFRGRGYRTWLAASPWTLGPADAALVLALIDGWAAAAAEQRPDLANTVHGWAERRRSTVAGGDFALVVTHQDLLALPPEGAEHLP
jgi:SAM-dependent methyltransferase